MWKMIKILALTITLIAGFGCDQGDFLETDNNKNNDTNRVSTSNHDILLPKGLATEKPTGDFDGIVVFAGSNNIPKSNKSTETDYRKTGVASNGLISKTTPTSRDLAAFIAQRPAYNAEVDAEAVLDSINTQLIASSDILSASTTSKKIFSSFSVANGIYELTLGTPLQPSELIFRLINLFGVNTLGGSIINSFAALGDEPFESNYRLHVGVIYFSASDIIIMAVVTPSDIASNYSHYADQLSSSTVVITSGATPTPTEQSFIAQAGGGIADFLFVIDNSGSMGDEQVAVGNAATAFEAAITNSGLDFQIGIITTDSDILRDGSTDGAFTNNMTEFTSDINIGTGGSATETGIYFAERSLQSIAKGDAADGTVTTAGHPRTNASLSVIILSDEASQYTSRSGGAAFDPASNLFISRKYRVYSIIEPADNVASQYDELAQSTGGSVADIDNLTAIPAIMNNIALDAGAASSNFTLSNTPIYSTITLTKNGLAIAASFLNGWSYNLSTNSITLHGTAVPTGGETIRITYSYTPAP